ncbi:MAG: TPM domain-containing protein [Bacteroidaceae bacterium]|nr:TPM domain-containing protein [Bacteroidaceae bacterium]
MRKRILALVLCLLAACSCFAFAAERDFVNDNNNWADIQDYADLLEDEPGVLSKMEYVTEYTNILVYTTNDNPKTAHSLAKELAEDNFGKGNGVVFLIDMDNRYIYIYAHNNSYNVITENVAETITDNVYQYASKERYDQCVKEGVDQLYMKFSGKRIPEPMRYIGNVFLAVMIGIGLTSVFACYSSRIQISGKTVKDVDVKITDKQRDIIDTKRVYRSSSSSGGSSRSGGGSRGGGGGGGSRGGGGGHRF